jgi:hypothetical protein
MHIRVFFVLIAAALVSMPAYAQDASPAVPVGTVALVDIALPPDFAGAAPPELPATLARDDEGRTTVRIVRLAAPLRVDGNLDEDLYRTVTPIADFIQAEPDAGAAATEGTEIWLSFDAENVYVSLRATESQPERMIVNEMRRDSQNLFQNENFQFAFDTFFDHRNSVSFQFNPIGGRMDGQITNESQFNGDWNPIWRLQVRRVQGGWTAEAAVPFKSLRFRPGTAQIWGFQARRINRWKNEVSYLTKLPANTGSNGHQRVSLYATMVGLEVPHGSRTLDLKPYLTSDVTTDLTAVPRVRNEVGKDFGFDAKYSVTQNLTADFTYNTDFAQVEADDQQVNLTRFSLFFPEKRDFFLENQGLFAFAQNAGGNNNNNNNSEIPTIFYSRRIGLDSGQQVPIDVGGRLSGRVGAYSVGVLNIRTGDGEQFGLPSNNFTVARMKRDILRRSAVGAIYTRRANAVGAPGDAASYGIDGSFAFFENLYFNTFWARTDAAGKRTRNTSYRTQMNYNADRFGVGLERLLVGELFDPQVGFLRRTDFLKQRVALRFSPRPTRHFTAVRKFRYQVSAETFDNHLGQMESRERKGEFEIEFQNSDKIHVDYENGYELLTVPFTVSPGVTIPVGGYDNNALRLAYDAGQQRIASGTWFVEAGPFYDGTRTSYGYSSARVRVTQQLSVEPGVQINHVTLPYGEFTTRLVSARTTYTLTPMVFVSGLVQFNSSNNSLGTNVRLRWEYQPGSELFVVYNEGRDTQQPGSFADLQNRSIVVKINRLFRF